MIRLRLASYLCDAICYIFGFLFISGYVFAMFGAMWCAWFFLTNNWEYCAASGIGGLAALAIGLIGHISFKMGVRLGNIVEEKYYDMKKDSYAEPTRKKISRSSGINLALRKHKIGRKGPFEREYGPREGVLSTVAFFAASFIVIGLLTFLHGFAPSGLGTIPKPLLAFLFMASFVGSMAGVYWLLDKAVTALQDIFKQK